MSSPESPSGNSNEVAANSLRDLAKNKLVALDLPSAGSAREESFDPQKGDKGLSYLAKRLYVKAGYNKDNALSAALMLSAKFVEKMGPDPILNNGDTLRIENGVATLITGINGSNPRLVEAQLTQEAIARAEENGRGPKLGLDLNRDADDAGKLRYKTITVEKSYKGGFRNLLLEAYRQFGYSIQDASVATASLWGGFMQEMDRPPRLQEGDRLSIGPDRAIFIPKIGPEITVELTDDAFEVKSANARAVSVTEKHKQRAALVGQIQITSSGQDILGPYYDLLSTHLVTIPNALIFDEGEAMPGISFCKVCVNETFYSVLKNKQLGKYKLVHLDSARDNRVITGPVIQDWTDDFEGIKERLA